MALGEAAVSLRHEDLADLKLQLADGPSPEIRVFRIKSSQEAIGPLAVAQFIADGGLESDLELFEETQLGHFLRGDGNIPYRVRWNLENGGWSNEEILERARRLYRILPPPEKPRQKHLTEQVIDRASYLGIITSTRQIEHPKRFGSSSNFYKALGVIDANIRHHELFPALAIGHVKFLHDKKGRMPTEKELRDDSRKNPKTYSYDTLRSRIPGGLKRVAKELGYFRAETPRDHVVWGVNFFVANDLLLPYQDVLNIYGKTRQGPSHSTVNKNRSMPEFKTEIASSYYEQLEKIVSQSAMENLAFQVRAQYDDPKSIFRFIRYKIVSDLLPQIPESVKIGLSQYADSDDNYVRSLQRYRQNIDWWLVHEISKQYDVFQDMWRVDYIDSLKIENVVKKSLNQIRGELSETDGYLMEDSVEIASDYLIAAGKTWISKPAVSMLRQRHLLPDKETFCRLFTDHDNFRILVRERVREKIAILENENQLAHKSIDNYVSSTDLPQELFLSISIDNENAVKANEAAANYIRSLAVGEPAEVDPKLFSVTRTELSEKEERERVAKLMVVDSLLPDIVLGDKLIICILKRSRSFVGEISRIDPSITAADIQHEADLLHVANYINEGRERHYRVLREIYRKYRRGQLNNAYRARSRALN